MIDYLFSIITTIVFDGLDDFGIIDTLEMSVPKAWEDRKGSSPKFDIISRVISR